ncbi:TetR/AcrR family transcriptional regulator [Lachnospiraceae bacterium 54-53]
MYETFEKLPDSKKEQIIQVCSEEFIEHGYQNASTNRMVKRLGISKGVLFLYFKNKKNLYLYLVEYIMGIFVKDYFADYEERALIGFDIFDNFGEFYKELMQKKTVFFLFILQAFINTPEELKEEINIRHSQSHEKMFSYINKAGLRQGVDIHMVDDLLHMVAYYVGQLIIKDMKGKEVNWITSDENNKNIVKYVEMLEKYADIVRYGVYKWEKSPEPEED